MRTDLIIMDFRHDKVLAGLKLCAKRERKIQSDFLAYLAEVDVRKLYAREGYSSLSGYLIEALGYSESSALKRIQVARMARRFPEIYYMLRDGRVSLTALSKLSPHIKRSNYEELLKEVEQKSVRDVERLLAARFPEQDSPDYVQGKVKPLSSDRIQVTFSADAAMAERIQRAKDVLRHKYPEGKLEEIFDEALELLLQKHDPQCTLKDKRPVSKVKSSHPHSRNIPRGIQFQVWERDGGQCSYVSASGKKCNSQGWLEWDHVLPWAMGGHSDDVNNIRLLCRTHNLLKANDAYGETKMWEKVCLATTNKQHFIEFAGRRIRLL